MGSENKDSSEMEEFVVLLYYKYQNVESVGDLVSSQQELCEKLKLTGRIRIAKEGINGTLSGTQSAIDEYIKETSNIFANVDWKFSSSEENAFENLQVKATPCIVGNSKDLDYSVNKTGIHLSPEEFHEKSKEGDAVLIDVRNSYEYAIGHFKDAVNPNTRSFSKFGKWIKDARGDGLFDSKKAVLMYCTGGIRCEKASIEMKSYLPDDLPVYQLKGGIHRYLEKYGSNGNFEGKNFVFDKRIVQPHCSNTAVVGTCEMCSIPYDIIVDSRRCKKCRLLMLICDKCEESSHGQYWCSEHIHLDPRTYKKNPEKLKDLKQMISDSEKKMRSEELKGRRNTKKRVAIQKKINELNQLLIRCE